MSKKNLFFGIIKWILSLFLYYSKLLVLLEWIWGRKFIVLCYHRVIGDKEGSVDYFRPQIAVSIETFRRQMDFLASNYTVVPLEELVNAVKEGKKLPCKAIAITFDDGYHDNYINAYPILKEKGLSATIFIATDYIGTGKILWFDKIYQVIKNQGDLSKIKIPEGICSMDEKKKLLQFLGDKSLNREEISNLVVSLIKGLKKREEMIKCFEENFSYPALNTPLMLTWEQVIEMSKKGISIGSHTKSHRDLTMLLDKEIESELRDSKQEIERKINRRVILFSYPDGYFNDKIKEFVKIEGFEGSCSTVKGKNDFRSDMFEIRRIGISERLSSSFRGKYSKALFATELNGIFDLLTMRRFRR